MRTGIEERPEFPPAEEPEGAIYEGFLGDADRAKVAAVRNAEPSRLEGFTPEFHDERLAPLLLHYKGRNFPEILSASEAEEWGRFRRVRLEKQAPQFLAELELLREKDEFLAEELRLYFESLLEFE